MPNHDLFDFLKQASDAIQAEYERITKRSREDSGTAGDEGEENWRELLADWLPHQCRVETKGRIMFANGTASPQVDVIVLSPEYPAGLAKKKMYLAAGVLAAFECKLTLRSNDINDAFANAAKMTTGLPLRKGTPYCEVHRPFIYGLLAHSHCWKEEASTPFENIRRQLDNALEKQINHPKEMPDVVCVSDLGTWTAMKGPHFGSYAYRDGVWYWQKVDPPAFHCGYMLHHDPKPESQCPLSTVGVFICDLLRRLGRERPELRSVADYFEDVGISGGAQGTAREWPLTILTDNVRQGILARLADDQAQRETKDLLKVTLADPWSEWGPVFL